MSRSPGTRSPSGPRPEPKPANVAPAANAAGRLRSAAPSRSCPRYEPTWRRPSQLSSGEWDSRPSLAPGASGPDARVTWRPVDGQHSGAGGPRPCGVVAKVRHRGLMALGGVLGPLSHGDLARASDGGVASLIRRDWRFDGSSS